MSWLSRLCWAAWFAALCWAPGLSRAEDTDYAPANQRWNGLSQLLAIARQSGTDVRAPARMNLGALRSEDGLLVVYPVQALPGADLSAFMSDGGRLCIADDYGTGGALLATFAIQRGTPHAAPPERRLRGNPNVLIARPELVHPLSQGVSALVTNHPQVLHHAALQAIFDLDNGRDALVLTGAVGQGRLVALGDPSVLINNMLDFRGNRRFATNLIQYLAPHGRLFIVTPGTELIGRYGRLASGDPLGLLRTGLQRLSRVRLPPAAVRLSSLVLAAVLLVGAATALPRRSTYARAVSLPSFETVAGFAGRVRFFAGASDNLTTPLLSYKLELEKRLFGSMALPRSASLHELEAAMQRAGLSQRAIDDARALLLELGRIALAHDQPAHRARVSAPEFHALVAAGDRILAALPERRARDSRS